MLTAEKLKSLLSYDPDTGVFTRNGMVAGWTSNVRRSVRIGKKNYYASRLAWLWMTGEWPVNQIDHIDGNKSNDAWTNLRQATASENNWNKPKMSRNTSGLKGVTWHKKDRVWQAQIMANRKAHHLGQFKCPAAASFAYQIAADKMHNAFSRVF